MYAMSDERKEPMQTLSQDDKKCMYAVSYYCKEYMHIVRNDWKDM